jgi:peptide/nickel transport system permease protein
MTDVRREPGSTSLWQRARRAWRLWASAVLLVALLATVVLVPLFIDATFDEIVGPPKGEASWSHPLGFDELGRDQTIRLATATRYSIIIALTVAILTTVIGLLVGIVAGWYGGLVDLLLSQVTNLLIVVPSFIVLLVAGIRWGADIKTMPVLLAVLLWPPIARIVRAMTLQVSALGYVRAAEIAGAGTARILRREVLPNLKGALLVNATLVVATAIMLESTLSFLGVGVKPPTPTLGTLVANSRSAVSSDPTPLIAPTLAIVLIVIAFNSLGESLQRLFVRNRELP